MDKRQERKQRFMWATGYVFAVTVVTLALMLFLGLL